jgi:pimeloyl-ACP methyl ester carboxylesterase
VSVRFVRTPEGKRLAYKETGDGPTLIFAAWWVSHLELHESDPQFRRFFEKLSKRHRVVRYDRIGAGLSDRDRETFTLEGELADFTALVDHIGAPRVDVFGSSFGGPLAIAYASRNPERVGKLVLYGTYAKGSEVAPREVQEAFGTLVRSSWGVGSRAMTDLFNPNADAATRARYALLQREAATPETAANILRLHYGLDATAYVAGVRAPALVLHRRGDRAIRYDLGRELAAKLADATFRTLEGSEHMPWEGDGDAVADATLAFLSGEKNKTASNEPELRRDGEVWLVAFGGKEARVRDSKGMGDLARLVARPGEAIHVRELLGAPVVEGRSEPTVDQRALRSYKERLEEIDAELEVADAGRTGKLRREREALLERLAADTGLRGRARKLNDPVERARKTVAARIRDALARIATVHPELGRHLQASISLGARCSYRALENGSRRR